MQHQLCVLLYSKYSPSSQRLVTALQSAPIDIRTTMGLTFVCIDNEDIRSKIQTSTSVEVNIVPTVLMVYNNGGVEKYEGDRAFMWAQQTVQNLSPPPPSPPPPLPPPPPPQLPPQPKRSPVTPPPDTSDDQDHKEKHKRVKSKKKTVTTKILDLDSESDDEDIKPPPVGIRKGAGEYEISQAFGEREEQNRHLSTRSKPTDLMSMAQAMQKERESVGRPQRT